MRSVCVVGGCGFIGHHLVRRLLDEGVERVVAYDNLSGGRLWHLDDVQGDPRLEVVVADVEDELTLRASVASCTHVVHFASNPDIARAMTDPNVDFHQGTALTHAVAEAARVMGVPRVLYASGSGIYGDVGTLAVDEDYGPLVPISTYGASKLAGESLLAAYSYMFGLSAHVFRFGNVVGPAQTHGVGYDFVRRLLNDPTGLEILGDGRQSKPYIHVDDVITAMLLADAECEDSFSAFNVAPEDHLSVREIADLAVETVLGPGAAVPYRFTGGDRGWKGDVPIVRLRSDRLRKLGWRTERTSRQAMQAALSSILDDALAGRFGDATVSSASK